MVESPQKPVRIPFDGVHDEDPPVAKDTPVKVSLAHMPATRTTFNESAPILAPAAQASTAPADTVFELNFSKSAPANEVRVENVVERSSRALIIKKQWDAIDAMLEAQTEALKPVFVRGYLMVWASYSGIAMFALWWMARDPQHFWFAPSGFDFAMCLALLTGIFARRTANGQAMALSFISIWIFTAMLERGFQALAGIAMAAGIAMLAMLVVGGLVWLTSSSFGTRPAGKGNAPGSAPPVALRSLAEKIDDSRQGLRRGLWVVGTLCLAGVLFNAAGQGASELWADSAWLQHEYTAGVARAVAGAIGGALLGWMQHLLIPDG